MTDAFLLTSSRVSFSNRATGTRRPKLFYLLIYEYSKSHPVFSFAVDGWFFFIFFVNLSLKWRWRDMHNCCPTVAVHRRGLRGEGRIAQGGACGRCTQVASSEIVTLRRLRILPSLSSLLIQSEMHLPLLLIVFFQLYCCILPLPEGT